MRLDFHFDPVIAQLGPFQLGWHGIFTALAVAAGLWLGMRLAEQRGVSADRLGGLLAFGIVGAIIGARAFHVADHWDFYAQNPLSALAVWQGGIAVYGSFVGAIVGGLIAAWRDRLPVWTLLDAAAPAMLLGQAVGRLGCLANGDAWGAPCGDCAVCVCVTYWHPNALLPEPLRGVPTHAYPLYELIAASLVLAGLWLFRRWLRPTGAQFLVAALGYAAIRFFLTYFRQETAILGDLQQAQVVALVTAVVVIVAYVIHLVRSGSSAVRHAEPASASLD